MWSVSILNIWMIEIEWFICIKGAVKVQWRDENGTERKRCIRVSKLENREMILRKIADKEI